MHIFVGYVYICGVLTKTKGVMKILVAGHRYVLDSMEGKNPQILQFIEKQKVHASDCAVHNEPAMENGPCDCDMPLVTVNDGTTNEEVIKVLIDRLVEMGKKFPCRENSLAVTKLEEALMWLEKRTADRVKRGVEGKWEK